MKEAKEMNLDDLNEVTGGKSNGTSLFSIKKAEFDKAWDALSAKNENLTGTMRAQLLEKWEQANYTPSADIFLKRYMVC